MLELIKKPGWKKKNRNKKIHRNLCKLERKNVIVRAQIGCFNNVWNKQPIFVCLTHLIINNLKIDHMWVNNEVLYQNYLLYDQIKFHAKIFCYRREDGGLSFTLCDLKKFELIK